MLALEAHEDDGAADADGGQEHLQLLRPAHHIPDQA
jgi:hypothetical protein